MAAPHDLPRYDNYIDGETVAPAGGLYMPTEDPYSGQTWASIARSDARDVGRAVDAASNAFEQGAWPQCTATQRGQLLWKLGDLIVANAKHLAEIEQRDNGKLATEVTAQVRYVGDYFKYYAGLADKIQSAVIPTDKKGVFAYTQFEPKGVVAIITPWNSPLTLTSWKLAPALAAGCTVVIKPSEFTSASMIEFAKLFAQAGFPKGVVNVVTGLGAEVGEALVTHAKVAHVGFTGGDAAGRRIYELAARGLKTVTLELGGKSPNIIFDDADLDQAVKGVVSGIFAASGSKLPGRIATVVAVEGIHDLFKSTSFLVAFVIRPPRSAIRRCRTRRSVPFRRARSLRKYFRTSKSPRMKARAVCWEARAARILGPGSSSSRPYSWTSRTACASRKKKYLVRCWRSFHSRTSRTPFASATMSRSVSPQRCGPATCIVRCCSPTS